MAERYDYNNANFCKRIKLRAKIADRNKIISGIVKNVGSHSEFYTLIMNRFYGKQLDQNIEHYEHGVSPISYFNTKALAVYKDYLDGIIEMVILEKNTGNKLTETNLRDIIILQAKIAREGAKKINALPEHNDKEKQLPKNITGAMIKKAIHTLTKSEVQIFGGENSVIENDPDAEDTIVYETRRPRSKNTFYDRMIAALSDKKQKPSAKADVAKDKQQPKKETYHYDKNLFGEKVVVLDDSKTITNKIKAMNKDNAKLTETLSEMRYELKASRGTAGYNKNKAEYDKVARQLEKNQQKLSELQNQLKLSKSKPEDTFEKK